MNYRESKASTPTPPSSRRDPLLPTPPPTNESPSRVERILRIIERYKRGLITSNRNWEGIKVNATEYTELERRLSENDFYQNKFRLGYFPTKELLAIRMPTRLHERFLVKVHNEIQRQLSRLAQGSSAEFARGIEFDASTTYIPSDPDFGRHDPDGSFCHDEERFPGVMIEAAYSQKEKMLGPLAEDYILGSNLKVRVMVGFDIEYKKNEAALSIWRPQCQQGEWRVSSEVQIIRHADGRPNNEPEAGLHLELRDFASVKFCERFGRPIDGSIFIPCKSLCTYLIEAELAMQARLKPESPPPILRKRRRTLTPDEELGTDDERNIAEAEERAAKRVDLEDTSYQESSSITSEND